MKTFFILLIFIADNCFSQVINPFPYKFSYNIYEEAKKNPLRMSDGSTASDLSFIGLYEKALSNWDSARQVQEIEISPEDSIDFKKQFQIFDAKKFIVDNALSRRAIIFNEAHYNPRHRTFLISILEELRNIGFTHFAGETFSNRNDSLFQINSNIPSSNSGYYSMEPQYGNLLREINRLGLKKFPYEDTTKYNGKRSNGKLREIGQAKNIAELLKSDSSARVIVLCGFDHIYEDSVMRWDKAMAGRLKEFTGIDPLTIDQIVLSERSSLKLSNPYRRVISTDTYKIIQTKEGIDNNLLITNQVDALLYAPKTKYKYNRPDWIFENNFTPIFIPKDSIKLSFPLIIRAYRTEEEISKLSIPLDIIEISTKEDLLITAIAVPKKYKNVVILINDVKGDFQTFKLNF